MCVTLLCSHIEDDADEGEDKIAKKQDWKSWSHGNSTTVFGGFSSNTGAFNNLPPSIEPTATGHIIEQIETVKKSLKMVMRMSLTDLSILMLLNLIKHIITVN